MHEKQNSHSYKKNYPSIFAAMYIRMSTDHQKYSTENQENAIRKYAKRHNLQIVSHYADEGKSGLDINGRKGLLQLIADVESGQSKFDTILVLDVTRWGRFQDADESAYYEYRCRKSGIDVRYIAEQFENDGSPISDIIKGVKRAMAGEYSRELSAKVFAGQCNLIEKGFRQGGPAGYGIRRMLTDEHGNSKGLLKQGEYKCLQTDRVILVPGPDAEIQVVYSIYQEFVDDQVSEREIADHLNQQGITTDLGRQWTRATVHQILTNEKYIGNNVYNRTSCKLKKQRVKNDPDMWVRSDGAFEPIIDPRYFYMAQGIITERSRKLSNEVLLAKLRELHAQKGWLSGILIDETDDMPPSSAYRYRFGSLIRAYTMIGYIPERDYRFIEINRHLRKMHPDIIEHTMQRIEKVGGSVYREETTDLVIVNNEISVSIVICRCLQTVTGRNLWKIRLDKSLKPDITIAVRMDTNNADILDYYLLPSLDIQNPLFKLRNINGLALDAYHFNNLEYFFYMAKRANIQEAA